MENRLGLGGDRGSWGKERGKKKEKEERERREGGDSKGGGEGKLRAR